MADENQIREFIPKIKDFCLKNPVVEKHINISGLIDVLNELDEIVEIYHFKSVLIQHITMILILISNNQIENKHMLHTVFYGAPGVGKTKVATVLAKIWETTGILKVDKSKAILDDEKLTVKIDDIRKSFLMLSEQYKNPISKDSKTMWKNYISDWENLKTKLNELSNISFGKKDVEEAIVIASREDFVAEYAGQTAIKTKNLLKSCIGKCLVIDEAYSLYTGENDTYGMEAITAMNKFMDKNAKHVAVIFTGYEDKLKEGIFRVQPGFIRRCQWFFGFNGYTAEGLAKIFKLQLKNLNLFIEDDKFINEFFRENFNHFPYFGGDTSKLALQCELTYSQVAFNSIVSNLGKISNNLSNDIILKAFDQYKSHRI